MKSCFHASAKRGTAFMVLLVWLFAVASATANACGVGLPSSPGNEAHAPHAGSSNAPHASVAAQLGASSDHDCHTEVSKTACLKICEDASNSLLQQEPKSAGFDEDLALVAIGRVLASPPVSSPARTVHLRPPEGTLPVRIRFSRLTL